MAIVTDPLRLRAHLPAKAWPVVALWLQRNLVQIRISKPRTSKLGDYRAATRHHGHRISVNADLNPYAFLVVLVHEFAHYVTFSKYPRHQPHGAEWKAEYKRLMRPFLTPEVFPPDILHALVRHLEHPPGSSCADEVLMRALHRHDTNPKPLLEDLPPHTVFRFNRRLFIKGKRLLKRYECRCLNNRSTYLIDPTAEVEPQEAVNTKWAS